MQRARLGRRNRKGSVLLPCFLDVHRSFSFGRHPSSVSVQLHRHFVFSRRSFLGHAHVKSFSSWIITCSSCTHMLEIGRACFGGMKKEQRIHLSQLVSAFSHAVPPSTPGPRMRPYDVSGNLSPRNRTLRSLTPISMSVPAEVEASPSGSASRVPRGFLIWNCVMGRWNWQVY